ncbi:MAG: ABC transporter permease [Deltaproteobacteria bacterium]|nr:ABC transporter permease [Deltaproteobacteria bacterium]
MKRYILIRVGQALITVVGVSLITFFLTHLSGDPIALLAPQNATKEDLEMIRIERGLDRPIHVQYWKWISRVVVGDFGESLRWKMPAIKMFAERFPNTLRLGLAGFSFAVIMGLSVGIISAVKVGSKFDNFGKIFALLGQALPNFWVGIMLILLFSVTLKILPTSGMGGWKHYLMPAFTLGWLSTAALTRLSRSAMLDVLDSEYIKLARIKGVSEFWVIGKHAFKNAAAPVITVMAMQFVAALNGTMIIEMIFNWPGVGRLAVEAVFARDYPVVQMVILISSSLFVFSVLVVDILYAYLDPRIRYAA